LCFAGTNIINCKITKYEECYISEFGKTEWRKHVVINKCLPQNK